MEKLLINNLSLAFERHGKGIPLLLIHGFPLDHASWNPLLPQITSLFDVILPDLPGFGSSDIPDEIHTIAEMAADLAVLLDELNIQKTCLAGHSMGGYVALAFAHAYPARVLGLGLIGSQAASDTAERKAGRYSQAGQVALRGPEEVVGMAEKLSADPVFEPFFREIILRQRSAGLVNAIKAMAERPDAFGYLERFFFPVTLLHGQADSLVPVERSREMKKRIPAVELVELPGVGHSPAVEAPLETARILLNLSGR